MCNFRAFENVKTLTLTCDSIKAIEGLESMSELEELCLNQNLIREIQGLNFAVSLKILNLSKNKIERIQGLESCTKLEVLWLNENYIEVLEGLSELTKLKQLCVAGNQISKIGSALNQLTSLQELNMSGNFIGSFREILSLTSLPALHALTFADPHFTENPVCNLCNYRIYTIYHLPQLKHLDCQEVSEKQKNEAESTFMRKKMYYNMRIKAAKRTVSNVKKGIMKMVENFQTQLFTSLRPIQEELKMTERELDEVNCGLKSDVYSFKDSPLDSSSETCQFLKSKYKRLKKIAAENYSLLQNLDINRHALRTKLDIMCKENISHLITELENAGNIRFEEGKPSDNWYQSCVNLVYSRYQGTSPLKVTRVTRIHNRHLRIRFEEKIENLVSITENCTKFYSYLFYGQMPKFPEELYRVIEEGFRSCEEYEDLGMPGCIPLSNSVTTTERARLLAQDSNINSLFSPPGQLLICKAYISEEVNDPHGLSYYPNLTVNEIFEMGSVKKEDEGVAIVRGNKLDPSQKVYFLFDNCLVLPEYLVQLEYGENPEDFEFEGVEEGEIERAELGALNMSLAAFVQMCEMSNETKFEEIHPAIPKRNKLSNADRETLKKIVCSQSFSAVETLNLSMNKISSLPYLSLFINLKELKLAFNKLEDLEDLKGCHNLVYLDLSHNQIKSLNNIHHLSCLQTLDISHNLIQDIRDLFNLSANQSLQFLQMLGNPLASHGRYRRLLILNLPCLEQIDMCKVSKEEKVRYSESQPCITPELARSHCIMGDSSASSGLLSAGEFYLPSLSLHKVRGDWTSQVEVLQLNYQKLASLRGIEVLKNLRRASFIGNMIKELKGIEACRTLEELSLEDNLISEIGSLSGLSLLKKLDLGRNFIRKIQGLDQLSCLTQLSLEDNLIRSLSGIEEIKTLLELYIGNNQLQSIKEVQVLKNLENLLILDISGNSFTKEDSRLYIVFHLKKLKVLDGVPIEKTEQANARDCFGGRLTEELIESRLGIYNPSEIRVLDLSMAKLRSFDNMINKDLFPMVTELNISGNYIQNLRFIGHMPRLIKLYAGNNRIESLVSEEERGLRVLQSLDTLDLSYNNIQSLAGLSEAKTPALRVLILTHNKIVRLEIPESLKSLRELEASSNSIRQIDPTSFPPGLSLQYVGLEKNRIKSLSNFTNLTKLQSLKLTTNRLQYGEEVEKIKELPYLKDLVLANNPLCKKQPYRLNVIRRLQNLRFLDGQEITSEERGEIVQEIKSQVPIVQPPVQKVPVKLTSVNLDAVFGRNDPTKKRPSSTNTLGSVLGVTPLNSQLKPKPSRK